MKNLWVCALSLTLLTSEASAACVDDLRKIADQLLFSNEAVNIEQSERRSTNGGEFIVYFDAGDVSWTEGPVPTPNNKDSGAPVLAIRSNTYGESWSTFSRVSFMNKNDFVVRVIGIRREAGYNYERASELLQVSTSDYLYCANALLIPNEIKGTEKEAAYKNDAEEERSFLFNAAELQPYLKRVK